MEQAAPNQQPGSLGSPALSFEEFPAAGLTAAHTAAGGAKPETVEGKILAACGALARELLPQPRDPLSLGTAERSRRQMEDTKELSEMLASWITSEVLKADARALERPFMDSILLGALRNQKATKHASDAKRDEPPFFPKGALNGAKSRIRERMGTLELEEIAANVTGALHGIRPPRAAHFRLTGRSPTGRSPTGRSSGVGGGGGGGGEGGGPPPHVRPPSGGGGDPRTRNSNSNFNNGSFNNHPDSSNGSFNNGGFYSSAGPAAFGSSLDGFADRGRGGGYATAGGEPLPLPLAMFPDEQPAGGGGSFADRGFADRGGGGGGSGLAAVAWRRVLLVLQADTEKADYLERLFLSPFSGEAAGAAIPTKELATTVAELGVDFDASLSHAFMADLLDASKSAAGGGDASITLDEFIALVGRKSKELLEMRQNAWASLIEAHNALGGAPGVAKLRTHFEAHAMRGGGGGGGGGSEGERSLLFSRGVLLLGGASQRRRREVQPWFRRQLGFKRGGRRRRRRRGSSRG